MGRMRTLKPEAATSESLSSVPRETRWTFAMLWTYLDDEGRGLNNARLIKAAIYPLDDDMTPEAINADIRALVDAGNLCLYVVDGKEHIHVPSWHDHQHPNRKVPSRLPACPGGEGDEHTAPLTMEHAVSTQPQRTASAVSTQPHLTPVVVVEGRGDGEVVGGERKLAPTPSTQRRPRPPDPLWDAVTTACGIDTAALTTSARSSVNQAVKQLRDIDADAREVPTRSAEYRRRYTNTTLTPSALAKHWPQLTSSGAGAGEIAWFNRR